MPLPSKWGDSSPARPSPRRFRPGQEQVGLEHAEHVAQGTAQRQRSVSRHQENRMPDAAELDRAFSQMSISGQLNNDRYDSATHFNQQANGTSDEMLVDITPDDVSVSEPLKTRNPNLTTPISKRTPSLVSKHASGYSTGLASKYAPQAVGGSEVKQPPNESKDLSLPSSSVKPVQAPQTPAKIPPKAPATPDTPATSQTSAPPSTPASANVKAHQTGLKAPETSRETSASPSSSTKPSLASSKYATAPSGPPAKKPQQVGLFVKGDSTLGDWKTRAAAKPAVPQRSAAAPAKPRNVSAPASSLLPRGGRGGGNIPPVGRQVPGPLDAPLRGEALIREQNRRALMAHGGQARKAISDGPAKAISKPAAAPTSGSLRPTGVSASDNRFDNLGGPSVIGAQHVEKQLRTMSDHYKTEEMAAIDPNADQRHVRYFSGWGQVEKRNRGPAEIRRVHLTNLPLQTTPRDIASMVWGGDIEEIRFKEGDTRGSVLFFYARNCARYHEDTANGIEYKNKSIWVELHDVVEPLIGIRLQMIKGGVTRCVRATNVDNSILPGELNKLGKDTKALEHLTMTFLHGRKEVTWRFCSLDAASSFSSALRNDARFKKPNVSIYFCDDPCRTATGVHD